MNNALFLDDWTVDAVEKPDRKTYRIAGNRLSLCSGVRTMTSFREAQAESIKALLAYMLETLGQTQLPKAPDFSGGLRAGRPSVLVTDETKIPGIFWETKRELRKAALSEALSLGPIEGACLSNKAATGLATLRYDFIEQRPYRRVESISFSALSQDRFDAWYAKAVTLLSDHLGVDVEAMLDEVEQISSSSRKVEAA